MELQILRNPEGPFTVTWKKSVIKLSKQVHITIYYENTTHIPVLHAYKIIYSTVDSLDMKVCVTS